MSSIRKTVLARRALLVAVAGLLLAPSLVARAGDPLRASPNARWSREDAAHLLRRAGFGGTPEQIDQLARLGRDRAVDYLVDYESIPQTHADYPVPAVGQPPRAMLAGLEQDERRRVFQMIQKIGREHAQSMQDWWVQRMVETPRPLEEKMTLLWHGHFTSGFREVKRPLLMYRQNQFLREHALSDFGTLVRGISRDPAMLIYLDGNSNVKGKPNENYARELMELFTLGEGHYTEQDVKEAARAFTGRGVLRAREMAAEGTESAFVFRSRRHDDGEKTVLGRTGKFDGDDVIDIILDHPATAHHLALKLWTFFVDPDPDNGVLEALAFQIRLTDYDLRETMRTILLSDAFYASQTRFALVKSPTELIVGTTRLLDVPLRDLRAANRATTAMGQQLFQPPTVKGWDGGRTWISTSTLFTRYNAVAGLVYGTEDRNKRRFAKRGAGRDKDTNNASDGKMMAELPAAARAWLESLAETPELSRPQPMYDPRPVIEEHRLRTAEKIVEHYVERLLQMELTRDRERLLIESFEQMVGRFDRRSPMADDQVRTLVHLIMSMPEYQLN